MGTRQHRNIILSFNDAEYHRAGEIMSLCLDVHKKFPGFSLDVSLDVDDESLAILGESG